MPDAARTTGQAMSMPTQIVHPDGPALFSRAVHLASWTVLAAALLLAALAHGAEAQAVITNGVIELGVDDEAQLNCCLGPPSTGTATTTVGLRYVPTNAEALAPGCLCEGWGVAYDGVTSGGANNAGGGAFGALAVNSFTTTPSTAVSDVTVGDLNVVHDYHPSATPDLYEATVTITNGGAVAHTNVQYRRVLDWDVEPTAFTEFVTIADFGVPPAELVFSSNDGFALADPLAGPSNLGFIGPGTGASFFDAGPFDHGALFDFDFGTLAPGDSVSFNIYYGAAPTEAIAYADLAVVDASVYSFGQPSTPGGAGKPGSPNTFIFAFAQIGCTDPDLCPPPTPGGASCIAHAVFARETDLSGLVGSAQTALSTSSSWTTPTPGAYAFSGFGPVPAPMGHDDAELASAAYNNPSLGIAVSARDVHSWCDVLAVDDPAGPSGPGVYTEAYGRAGLSDFSLASPLFSLAGVAGDFSAKAWGFPGGTFGAQNCDVTSGSFGPPPGAWVFPCPGPNTVLYLAPGVTLTLNEQFGPVPNAAGQEVYGGAIAHLTVVVPGVSQVDVYLGYVAVAVTP